MKIALSIIGVILVALGILTAIRWDAWFHNPEEQPYKAPDVPSRVILTFGNHGENSRFVGWTCGEEVDKSARLYLVCDSDTIACPATGEVFVSRSGKAVFYRCELKGLKPLSDYSYQVESKGVKSKWYRFHTSDPKAKSFSFMYVGDVQDTINGVVNRMLKRAIQRHPEVEFIAFAGDLIERPTDAYFNETFRGIDSICTAMPIMNVTGNHDYLKYPLRKLERRFPLTFPYFLEGMKERDDNNQLYALKYHNTAFFLLDSDREIFFLFAQAAWLKAQMEQIKADHRIVMLHHPLYSVRRESNNLIQRWMFNDIIRDAKTDLVLQGHEHGYAHCTADETPLKGHDCLNPPLYVISHCSPKEYHLHPSKRFYPVIQGSRYYQIIDVDAKAVTYKAYDVANDALIDSVRISKAH